MFKRFLSKLVPFRGNTWWEMQIGPLVLQIRHKTPMVKGAKLFNAFIDPWWNL